MKWLAKRSLRAIARRSSERLEAEFGGTSAAEMLGLAAAFACRPEGGSDKDGAIRRLLFQTRERGVSPCPAPEANRQLEAWLDYGLISTTEFFQRVWSLPPADLLELLFEPAKVEV